MVEFGSLYSIRAKKIAEDSTQGSPDFQVRTSATISISDLLDIVNEAYSDVLPKTVAEYYGNERRDTKLGKSVKYSLSKDSQKHINEITDDGLTMTYVRVPNQNTQNYGNTYGQNIEPSGEYMSMDTSKGKHKIDGYEYGTIQFKKPLVLEHINTSDTGWKKTVSDMYGGLTGKKLTKALIKDGYDAIVTYDEYGYSEIVNLNGTKLNNTASGDTRFSLGEQPKEYGNSNTYGKDIALDSELAPVQETAQEAVQEVPTAEDIQEYFGTRQEEAPLPNDYMAVEHEQQKAEEQPEVTSETENVADYTNQEAPIAKIIDEEPTVEHEERSFVDDFMESFVDKGYVFEKLSKKTRNRELEAKWNFIRYADRMGQDFIGKGADNVRALNDIQKEVEEKGLRHDLAEYLYHQLNIDRMTLEERFEDVENKPVYGESVTADVSRAEVSKYEKQHPEFKRYADEIYAINNHLRGMLVDGGVISQETADLWAEMYPHYVPIRRVDSHGPNINVPLDTGRTGVNAPVKRATGGSSDILPLFGTMAQRALQTYKAVAKNRFGVELKNSLGTVIGTEAIDIDGVMEGVDNHEELLQEGKRGRKPTFTVFENGERVTFEITDSMYDALKPTDKKLARTHKIPNKLSNWHRGLLTNYNPSFMLRNPIKDAQDVLINSQHAFKTYANFPKAIKEIATKGEWYKEYMKNGGGYNTYFDKGTNTFVDDSKENKFAKVIGLPLINKANEAVEQLPRIAEYIASREMGRSVEVSMLDSARVTTNFSAGGDATKYLNRNGATFLNASVQGTMQQVRNIQEAKMNGLKGVTQLATKYAVAGLPVMLLNSLLWDDDEEYEELSDYVKQNYYVVAKYGDGKFVRIPKGRMLAVIQNAFEQIGNAITGNDDVDFESFGQLLVTNLAPNNPVEDNILAPILQVASNTTWYGDDLVPTRLQDLPDAEQYDETTDSISRWLGEKLDYSPYKINYLLDQYTGAIGDSFLPMLTPEAESEEDTFMGELTAPIRSGFTTDSVIKNQNVSDFYDMKDKLATNAKGSKATDEDILSNKYFNSVNTEIGKLYAEKRAIQNSNLSDNKKYNRVRDIQKEINTLAEKALNEYGNVNIDGNYATVGDRQYYLTDEGWEKLSADDIERLNKKTSSLGIAPSEYYNNKEEYDFAYDSPKKYSISKVVGGFESYKQIEDGWAEINGKDENGKTVSGLKKERSKKYIWDLNLEEGQKVILYRSLYDSNEDKDKYNPQIVEYLDSREDISWEETVTILEELDMKVSSNGVVTW